jgi:hypothetical protein
MQEPLKYFHVNWMDGMKINKDHFIAMENNFSDRIKDVIGCSINKYNYGILPPLYGKDSSLKIVLNIDNQNSLRVKLFECRAITPGGSRIEIYENSADIQGFTVPFPETAYEFDTSKENTLYIVLSVNPFSRIPVGNADPSEEPPRYPYTIPELKIHLIPEEQLSKQEMGMNFLFIGKIRITEDQTEIIKDYIPPSTSIRSYPQLIVLHAEFDKFFSQLELDVLNILKKIHEKELSNVLAKVVSHLSEYLIFYLSTNILYFRWMIIDQPPLAMFEFIASFARVIKNTIDANSGKEKEELLNYFSDWCNLKQGEFENILINTVNFHYDHTHIQETAVLMTQFSEVINSLFNKLSKLEYIGKKKGTNIFVKEQTAKKSFLAD